MKSRIVRIGNSQGIRIPKPLIEQTGLSGEVEIDVEGNCLIIRPTERPRSNWADAFARMGACGDDALVDGNRSSPTQWEKDEWEW